jgi:hypothetical protein
MRVSSGTRAVHIRHPGKTTSYVDGVAASAASLVALAADEIVVSAYGQVMLHNARGGLYGTAEELRSAADALGKLNSTMAEFYADRAGGTAAGWSAAMARESWFTAQEALDAGLATRIDDSGKREDIEAAATASIARAAALFKYPGRQAAPDPEACRRRVVAMARARRTRRARHTYTTTGVTP